MAAHEQQFEASYARKAETKESKEGTVDSELTAAAAMERADYLIKEVKSNTQQMQNIVMHMAQVQKAIADIRKQLQLVHAGDPSSLTRDEIRIQLLRKKIELYRQELFSMKHELLEEQYALLRAADTSSSEQVLREKALKLVSALLGEFE